MSRLGKKPVPVPAKVSVAINGRTVKIANGDKSLSYEHRPEVSVAWNEGDRTLSVSIDEKDEAIKSVRAHWGTTRAVLANMITGVTAGFEKKLEVVGVGYTAELAGQKLKVKAGFANTIEVPVPAGVNVTVEKNMVTVKGIDRQKVGQFASVVRSIRKPEPYNGKGIKYSDEVVRRKAGKAFGSGG